MRKIIIVTSFIWLLVGCSSDEPNFIPLAIDSFELNQNCFSAIKLQQAEVVITNAEDYQLFEDSIRVYWLPMCNTTYLPPIDFDSSFFVGKYTQSSGCSISYNSQAEYNDEQYLYNYTITVTSIGTCERLNTAFNCAIIPRKSDQINVTMQVEYRQQ